MLETINKARKMVQGIKELAAKTEDLSSILGIHTVKEKANSTDLSSDSTYA